MGKLTLVIPTYTLTPELENYALQAIRSYKSQVDEIIVSEDGGEYSQKICDLVDTYIYNKKNQGFTFNVNRGWKQSTGDFTAIVNSDTYLVKGNLKDLCIPGRVTSPKSWNEPQRIPGVEHTGMLGYFFVVPKEVQKERGLLMEDMKMYGSDSEYEERVADIYQHIPTVEIMHDWNKSSKQVDGLWQKMKRQQRKDVVMLNEVIKKGGMLNDKRHNLLD